MASRNSDVTLVVRARDEAQKTLDSVSGALEKLFGAQNKVAGSAEKTGANISELAKIAGTLDKAYATIAGSADKAAGAFERQRSAISEQRSQLQAVQQQATAAAAALAKLNSADSIVGAGRNQAPRLAQIKLITAEYDRLQNQSSKLATSIATQERALDGSASSLQRLGSQANAVEAAVAGARIEIDKQTAALNRQAAAAQTAGRVNTVTGVQRPAATDVANGENVATFEALAKREITLQHEREAAARAAAQAVAESVRSSTGIGRVAATDKSNGENIATFSALADREQATVLREAAQAHQMFEARVKAGAAAMRDEARAAADVDDYVRELRAQLDPTARATAYLAEQTKKLDAAFKSGKISSHEYQAALKLIDQSADQMRKKPQVSLFGLKPYETQNLMFQFNDIATQLASGTSLSQTLAQQGGQILQLFPRVGASIAGALSSGPVIAFVATLGTLILVIHKAVEEADRLRQINATLDSSASGGDYNAKALSAAAKELDHYGLSAEQAIKIVKTFVNDGLPQARIEAFGRTAKDMADVLGIDVVDAAKQLGDAFNGTYEGIKNLDNATNLLSASERERIKSLFDQGKAQEAMAFAFDKMSGRLEKGAQDMRGPWAEATRALSGAWDTFLTTLSKNSYVSNMGDALTGLADSVTRLLNSLSGATTIRDIDQEIAGLQKRIGDLNFSIGKMGGDPFGLKQMQIDEAVGKMKELIEQRKKLLAEQNPASVPGSSGSTSGGSSGGSFGTNPKLKKESDEALANMTLEQKLQALREKGQKSVANLRARNEGFMSEAEKRRREALAGELAATKAIGDQRVKDAARAQAIQEERTRIQGEQDSFNTAANTPQMLARQFVAGREGFRQKAYWDVNHFRVGFGSDTKTSADGSVSNVTASTTVTLEDAIRDLDRRIGEFQNAIKATIGADRFNSFSPQQQAAVTSVAYNYGKLPPRILEAVRNGTAAEIATAIEGLGNDNKGINRNRRNLEASTFRTANVALDQNTALKKEDTADSQQKFNSEIEAGNAKLALRTRLMNEQSGLLDTQLLQAQAQAAADEAELALKEKFKAINEARAAQNKELITLSQAEIDATRKAASEAVLSAKAVGDAQRAAAQRPVDDLTAKRDAIQSQLDFAAQQGNQKMVSQLQPQLDAVNKQLIDALANLQNFWAGVAAGGDAAAAKFGMTAAAVQAIIDKLKLLGSQTAVANDTSRKFLMTGQQINEQFASGAANAFDRFAQSVAEGKNVFKSLRDAFLQFASDFIRQIAQMIIKQAIFNAIGGTGGQGGVGGGISGAIGGLFGGSPGATGISLHDGGIAGETFNGPNSGPRLVNPQWYANARRYHTGGIAGLAPNEVPAVLQRGEEVLTRDDPRHMMNGGGGANVKIINAIDAADMVSQGMNTSAGEKAVLNLVRNNPGAFKAALG